MVCKAISIIFIKIEDLVKVDFFFPLSISSPPRSLIQLTKTHVFVAWFYTIGSRLHTWQLLQPHWLGREKESDGHRGLLDEKHCTFNACGIIKMHWQCINGKKKKEQIKIRCYIILKMFCFVLFFIISRAIKGRFGSISSYING